MKVLRKEKHARIYWDENPKASLKIHEEINQKRYW